MNEAFVEDVLGRLRAGHGVWLAGAPGSGRSHVLQQVAAAWTGEVLRLSAPAGDWQTAVPAQVLTCLDPAPEGLDRGAVSARGPVLATGPRPGDGWTVVSVPPLPEDESVRLFLRHAPVEGSRPALRRLARRLGGHPTAIVAAARRWPAESLAAILEEPSADWPGLRSAYDALGVAEKDALALLSRLPGPARHEGVVACGHEPGVRGLVTAGWATVAEPGTYALPPAIADAVRPWRGGGAEDYFAWFADEARARFEAWQANGGSPAWFRSGLWPALHERGHHRREPWFYQAWVLSSESPDVLLEALAEAEAVIPAITLARTRAQAHQILGERQKAADILQVAVAAGAPDQPREAALAQLELAVAHHRLRDLDTAGAGYAATLAQLEAMGLRRERVICLANIASFDHAKGQLEAARAGYRDAIAEATSLGITRIRCHLSCNLGSLLLEMGDRDGARVAFQDAIRNLDAEDNPHTLALARMNQSALELLEGHLDVAERRLAEAFSLYSQGRPAAAAICLARRGAVAALRGDLERARELHDQAAATVPMADTQTTRQVALWRAVLEWETGDHRSALDRRRASLDEHTGQTRASGEARLAVIVLEQRVGRPGSGLLVGPDGAWFRSPGAERVSVARYGAASRILAHLARTAEDEPGTFCSADDLIAAGWPGEKISVAAARNRLAVTLARLRKLGLKELIQRAGGGWRFDPDFATVLLQRDEPDALPADTP